MAADVSSAIGLLESQELVLLKDVLESTDPAGPISFADQELKAAFEFALSKAQDLACSDEDQHASTISSCDTYREAREHMQDPAGAETTPATAGGGSGRHSGDVQSTHRSGPAQDAGGETSVSSPVGLRSSPFERAISVNSWIPDTPAVPKPSQAGASGGGAGQAGTSKAGPSQAGGSSAAGGEPNPTFSANTGSGSLEEPPMVPTAHCCADGTLVTLRPMLWRHFEEPYRLMVNVGLRTTPPECKDSCTQSFYTSLNPRVVTTGVPARRHHPYRRDSEPLLFSGKELRSGATARAASGPLRVASGALSSGSSGKLDRDAFRVLEVQLVKRSLPGHAAVETWSTQGPVEGTTLADTPVWPGTWAVDVRVKVADHALQEFWIAAYCREIAEPAFDVATGTDSDRQ